MFLCYHHALTDTRGIRLHYKDQFGCGVARLGGCGVAKKGCGIAKKGAAQLSSGCGVAK